MNKYFMKLKWKCKKIGNQKLMKCISKFIKRSVFWYPLILSLLSALIFYYFFSILPRQSEINKIKPHVEYLTDKILLDGMFIVTEMTHENISQNQYNNGNITVTEFKNALKGINFNTKLRYVTINNKGESYNTGDFVADYLSNIKTNSDILFRYIIYLDTEEINIINELLRNDLFELWNNSRFPETINIDGKIYKPEHQDLTSFADKLYNFYITLNKLNKYAHENIYTKLKSLQIKASNAYFSQQYRQAIEYNREILKIKKKDKDAMFYYGASLLANNEFKDGVYVLTEMLQLYPEEKAFVKSNISNEFAKSEIFKNIK